MGTVLGWGRRRELPLSLAASESRPPLFLSPWLYSIHWTELPFTAVASCCTGARRSTASPSTSRSMDAPPARWSSSSTDSRSCGSHNATRWPPSRPAAVAPSLPTSTVVLLLDLLCLHQSTLSCIMASEEDVKQRQIVEDRARNISHNVRCTECGSQSIEDSQADVAVLLRRLIRDEIKSGKSDKEIYKKLEDDFGETVLYAPKFDLQTAAIWLSPVIVGGVAAGMWAYQKHRQRTNVHIMALNLVRGVPLTPREKETMIDILTPPPPPRRWWWPVK